MGTRIHDVLEAIVVGQANAAQLLPALDDELENLKVLNLDFPRDFKGGAAIRDNWIADMKHFCLNFVAPKGKFITEELILFELDEDHYFHGSLRPPIRPPLRSARRRSTRRLRLPAPPR